MGMAPLAGADTVTGGNNKVVLVLVESIMVVVDDDKLVSVDDKLVSIDDNEEEKLNNMDPLDPNSNLTNDPMVDNYKTKRCDNPNDHGKKTHDDPH